MMRSDLQIRDVRPNDQEAVRAVTLVAYQEYTTQLLVHWEGYQQNILATLADVKPAEQIVAEQEGTILGTVLRYPAGTAVSASDGAPVRMTWPEVRWLAVAPAAWWSGMSYTSMAPPNKTLQPTGAA